MGFFSDVGDFVTDTFKGITGISARESGEDAAKAAQEAAGTQADYQQQALDYLKSVEELPQQFREGALTELAGMYGLEGGTEGAMLPDQAQLIEQAQMSPLYAAIMGTQGASEEAILRNAAATGGLRSGNVQAALAENAQQLENEALLTSYNQQLQEQQMQMSGLQGLAGLQSYAPQIAQATQNIGTTMAQGITGAAQAQIAGQNMATGQVMDLANLGMGAYAAFSDIRLKEDIKHVGYVGEHKWYEWTWNKLGEKLGLSGKGQGVMAHEVYEANPDITGECEGFITVDYGALYG